MNKIPFYAGAFLGAAVMTLIHFVAPGGIRWWTPLLWLATWVAIEVTAHFGARAIIRYLDRNRKAGTTE